MEKISVEAIDNLVSRFSEKSLPKDEWTHQAHILVALWHNLNHDFDTALVQVKSKIKAYNLSVGTLNTDDAGYHESLTIFWMILTKRFLLQNPKLSMQEACHRFLQSEMASKDIPLHYYSKEFLMSKAVRKRWQNGDIQPLSLLSHAYKLGNHFDLSDENFVQAFVNCTLPPALFSHEAHLRLAWIHLKALGLEDAVTAVCDQITAFVRHVGAENKYNKTLTVAAVKVVNHFMNRAKANNFLDFILEFPDLKGSFKALIAAHYSFDIFTSEKAKKEYFEPDLLPFK